MKNFVLLLICILPFTANGQTSTLPYAQDFEGSQFLPAGWQAFGSNGNAAWQHSTTISAYGNGSGCAYFDNFTNNVSGNYYGMRCMALNLSNAGHPMMRFDVAYARKDVSHSDHLGIWYSYNGTSGWNNIITYQDGTLTTAPDQTTLFTPAATDWDSIVIDLSQFAGVSYVRFAFENNSDNGNVVYIDNVRFYDAAPTTGVTEENTHTVNIWPTPTAGRMLTMDYGSGSISEVHFYAITGAEFPISIEETAPGQALLHLGSAAPGMYILHYMNEQRHYTQRVLLQ